MDDRLSDEAYLVLCSNCEARSRLPSPENIPLLLPPALHQVPQHGSHVNCKGPLNAAVGRKADYRAFSVPHQGAPWWRSLMARSLGALIALFLIALACITGRQIDGSEAVELVLLAIATPLGVTVADPAQGLLKPAKAKDEKK